MGSSKSTKMKKRLDMFRRTMQVNAGVERGSIEGQALNDSAGESPNHLVEAHAEELLDKLQEEMPKKILGGKKRPRATRQASKHKKGKSKKKRR